jgi:hypothetical protein
MKTLFTVATLNKLADLHANDANWDFWSMTEAQIYAELLLIAE